VPDGVRRDQIVGLLGDLCEGSVVGHSQRYQIADGRIADPRDRLSPARRSSRTPSVSLNDGDVLSLPVN
jgi:hypothetical protein